MAAFKADRHLRLPTHSILRKHMAGFNKEENRRQNLQQNLLHATPMLLFYPEYYQYIQGLFR